MEENTIPHNCPHCGGHVVSETVGHTNNHDQPDFQVTVVHFFCESCNAFIGEVRYDTDDEKGKE